MLVARNWVRAYHEPVFPKLTKASWKTALLAGQVVGWTGISAEFVQQWSRALGTVAFILVWGPAVFGTQLYWVFGSEVLTYLGGQRNRLVLARWGGAHSFALLLLQLSSLFASRYGDGSEHRRASRWAIKSRRAAPSVFRGGPTRVLLVPLSENDVVEPQEVQRKVSSEYPSFHIQIHVRHATPAWNPVRTRRVSPVAARSPLGM